MSRIDNEIRALLRSSSQSSTQSLEELKFDDVEQLPEYDPHPTGTSSPPPRRPARALLYFSLFLNVLFGAALSFAVLRLSHSVQWRGAKPLYCT